MAIVNKIDSNVTGLRFAEESAAIKVLPTAPANQIWYPLEPNEYNDFGGQVSTVARSPINPARQRKKGGAVDLDASGGFQSDLTQENLQRLMQGFMFADFREKANTNGFGREATYNAAGAVDVASTKITISNVDGTTEDYDTAGDFTAGSQPFRVGDLIFARGFTNTANNGLKRATAVAATAITVAEDLVDETPPAAAQLTTVGFQFDTGDLDVDASSGFPRLTTTTKDLRELGLTPGEWIYIGGDTAATAFTNVANNGFKRVRSIAQNEIVLDKSDQAMVTEADTTQTVQVFVGRTIKNESDPDLIKRRTYQFERSLGANDNSDLTLQQAEYLVGALPNELTFNIGTADKVTVDVGLVAVDSTTIDENTTGADTIKSAAAAAAGSVSANSPPIVEADLFNTSSDVQRVALTQLEDGVENPEPLFAFVQEFSLSINNNVTPNKAVGVFGAFDVTVGTFQVDANATAYFADVAAIQAVRDTVDVSFDWHFVRDNGGVSFDLPLVTLGDGRPNVAQDEPITIPLSNEAATGAKVNATLDHTLLIVFWDYLPDAADS